MKIAISAEGQSLESSLDPRFGRAAYFLLVDPESFSFTVLDNHAASAAAGAGIATAQKVIDLGAQAVITGHVGPNAMEVLQAGEIGLYHGMSGSVRDNVAAYNAHKLESISNSGPAHAGIGPRG